METRIGEIEECSSELYTGYASDMRAVEEFMEDKGLYPAFMRYLIPIKNDMFRIALLAFSACAQSMSPDSEK